MTTNNTSEKFSSAGDLAGVVGFCSPEFLTVMKAAPPAGIARVVLLAIVEDRGEGLLTNRIYLLDVVLASGEARSFLQGYSGGASFTENNFIGDATDREGARLVHEFSDAWCGADEDLEFDDSIGLAETLAADTIGDFGCYYDGDVARFSSLDGFSALPEESDLHIQYRVWYEGAPPPPSVADADWGRLQAMLEKSGVTIALLK